MIEHIFAYGTLQPGCAPAEIARLAAKLLPVGMGSAHGVLYDLGRYPGAIADAGSDGKIFGTVMELPEDESVLRRLDEYEGFDPHNPEASEFVRERQTVELKDGRSVDCWFYRYNGTVDEARRIKDGVWRTRAQLK